MSKIYNTLTQTPLDSVSSGSYIVLFVVCPALSHHPVQYKKAEAGRMVLRTETHTIISHTSFPLQKCAVTKI